jgi:Reverse transcriptase (RNA-dependent DNA polymerase)
MKEKYDEYTAREQAFDKNFTINTKEVIKRSLNRYTETITINNAQKRDIESDFEILNIHDQVKTEIASQSHSLSQSRPNENNPVPENWKRDFNDLIKKPEHMSHISEPPTLHKVVQWLQKLGQDKAPGPSGLTIRHLRRSGLAHKILKIFLRIHETKTFPKDWPKGNLVYLAKKDNSYQGKLNQLRPITLLKTICKV